MKRKSVLNWLNAISYIGVGLRFKLIFRGDLIFFFYKYQE